MVGRTTRQANRMARRVRSTRPERAQRARLREMTVMRYGTIVRILGGLWRFMAVFGGLLAIFPHIPSIITHAYARFFLPLRRFSSNGEPNYI